MCRIFEYHGQSWKLITARLGHYQKPFSKIREKIVSGIFLVVFNNIKKKQLAFATKYSGKLKVNFNLDFVIFWKFFL